MTEEEYLNMENLTRIRVAGNLISRCVFYSGKQEEKRKDILKNICVMEDEINKKIKVRGGLEKVKTK